jgi:hypothetical protein
LELNVAVGGFWGWWGKRELTGQCWVLGDVSRAQWETEA